MKTPVVSLCVLMAGVLLVHACAATDSALTPAPRPEEQAAFVTSGGRATVFDNSKEAFSHRIPNPDLDHRTQFFTGESLFDQNWVAAPSSTLARDGLGPLFNARSCAACHGKDGRSNPFLSETEPDQALLVRLSAASQNPQSEQLPHAVLGGQLQPFALPLLEGEGSLNISWKTVTGSYADGTSYRLTEPIFTLPFIAKQGLEMPLFSVRQSPQLIGLGLLEQIPESTLLGQSDPEDRDQDGISGRPNRVWDVTQQKNVLGRFGWKANQPTIKQQVAGAFHGDLGITTSLFPLEDVTAPQSLIHNIAYNGPVPNGMQGNDPELPDRLLDRVTFYIANLAVPARRHAEREAVKKGEALFAQLACQKCHTPRYTLESSGDKDIIAPYSDLLLHDMGPALADHRPDFDATGQEWRTPPLWGIGLIETVNGHTRFLHDGRARNLTEAVLWHGGEAQAAQKAFTALSAEERQQLIEFLESL